MHVLFLLTLLHLGPVPNTAPVRATTLTPNSDFYIGSSPSQFTRFGNLVYFLASTDTSDQSYLHFTDGTVDGSQRVLIDGQLLHPLQFLVNGDVLYLVTEDGHLATIDRPGADPVRTDIVCGTLRPGEHGVLYHREGSLFGFTLGEAERFYANLPVQTVPPVLESDLVELNQVVYVVYAGYEDKLAFYRMDGSGGPVLVADLFSETRVHPFSVTALKLVRNGDQLIINATYDKLGPKFGSLWLSDGSTAGTHQLTALVDGVADEYPQDFLGTWHDRFVLLKYADNEKYVLVIDQAGQAVMKVTLEDFVWSLTQHGDDVTFNDSHHFYRLTHNGELSVIFETNDVIYHNYFKPWELDTAGKMRFFTFTEAREVLAWSSDGTTSGTQALVIPEPFRLTSRDYADFGTTQWFVGSRDDRSEEEVIQISSANGAQYLDLNPNLSANDLSALAFGNRLLFLDQAEGYPLRITDGTVAGTQTLTNLNTSRLGAAVAGDIAYFWKQGDLLELWKTDGTPAGTVRIKVFTPGEKPSELLPYGDQLYLTTFREPYELLYHSDGTTAGTRPVDLFNHNLGAPNHFFPNSDGGVTIYTPDDFGDVLIYLDPDNQRLSQLASLPRYNELYSGSIKAYQAAGRTWVVFSDRKSAIWVSDHTQAGTLLFAEGLDDVSNIVEQNGQAVMFLRKDNAQGLYTSDGTAAYAPASLVPSPNTRQLFQPIDQYLYGVGDRIWVYDGVNPPQTLSELPDDADVDQLLSTAAGTLLITRDSLGLRGTLTNGTPAGTRLAFESTSEDIIYFDAKALGDQLHLIGLAPGSRFNRILYRWEAGLEAPLEDEDGLAIDYLLKFYPAGDHLYFPASDHNHQVGLYSFTATEEPQPDLTLKVTPWFFLPSVFRVEVTPLPGAVYHWSVEGGNLINNGQNYFALVHVNGMGMATVRLTVDLPDGSHRQGEVMIETGIQKSKF